ncbi:MAG: VOC family protein [Ilumatobacter sp.]|uniref:VOC family protein n=1 Tax=Ilumatobacter sp. TaxID=1967498 RepID=UPI0032975F73
MSDNGEQLQIGAFGELVGLSVPQLRRYDRLGLLVPEGRTESGYRHYNTGQSGAGRAISLLRSMDMPLADIRRLLEGTSDAERHELFRVHRARLEARLDETRQLLHAVDSHTKDDTMTATDTRTDLSAWLHVMPRIPVTDLDRSERYYEEVLGFRAAWRTSDGAIAAVASGGIEMFLLIAWHGDERPPIQSAYVYVEDPDSLWAEYEQAGAVIVEPVDSRPNGMRDFTLIDPDGHRFTLGRGEERLREVADYYGMTAEEIAVDPDWLRGG